jgi:hypothetical protein
MLMQGMEKSSLKAFSNLLRLGEIDEIITLGL